MIIVFADLKVAVENRDAFLTAAEPLVAGSRAEAGCISYDLYENPYNPGEFRMLERWADGEAIAAHREEPHFKAFGAAARDLLAARPEIVRFDASEAES
ncbi:MAG: putative quinol monooxygenase [Maricaulaceae bacterium]|jgi:quinol monooxygenase YgiN